MLAIAIAAGEARERVHLLLLYGSIAVMFLGYWIFKRGVDPTTSFKDAADDLWIREDRDEPIIRVARPRRIFQLLGALVFLAGLAMLIAPYVLLIA